MEPKKKSFFLLPHPLQWKRFLNSVFLKEMPLARNLAEVVIAMRCKGDENKVRVKSREGKSEKTTYHRCIVEGQL